MTEIKTGEDFKATFPDLGILPSHALAAIREPATQHIITVDGTEIMALYLAPDTRVSGAFMLSLVVITESPSNGRVPVL